METEKGSVTQQQAARKRPREEPHGERSVAQRLATGASSLTCAAPGNESAHSFRNQQHKLSDSASTPVGNVQAVAPIATLQQISVEEDDDVEAQLMRALEEELEAPRAKPATVFQDADEDDNYDESEDDDE